MSVLDQFAPDADGIAMAEMAARWLAGSYRADPSGFSGTAWGEMAAAGWMALRLPEEVGGLDLPLASCLGLVQALGAACVREPVVESALVAAPLAARADAPQDLLQGLADGSRLAVLADDGLSRVPGGDEVTDLLVYECDGGRTALVHLLAADTEARVWSSVDGRRMADRRRIGDGRVLLEGAPAAEAVLLARAERLACLAAEASGAMNRAMALTATYLSERRQFGRPLAEFQVLSHRMADMLVDVELSKSSAAMLVPAETAPSPLLADRATAQIARALRLVGEQSIQLHGGMGMTEEMEIGRVFKRLLHLAVAMGGETAPRARIRDSIATKIAAEREAS